MALLERFFPDIYVKSVFELPLEDLKKLGVVVKRAQFFITCCGRMRQGLRFSPDTLPVQLAQMERGLLPGSGAEQLSLFDDAG